MKKQGFRYEERRTDGSTVLIHAGGFEAEFLAPQIGRDDTVIRTPLGVKAQRLPHMRMLVSFAEKVNFEGMEVTVPWPEAYALHKMAINRDRQPADKAEADRRKIRNITGFLDAARMGEVYESLSRKEKKAVEAYKRLWAGG